jgi:hypothetical protein
MAYREKHAEPAMTSPVYLIIEPIDIIATDLAHIVQDFDADAIVLVAKAPDDAMSMIAGHPAIHAALIHASPQGHAESDLGIALAARNTRCVFMGDAAERAATEMHVLLRPFSTATVAALLEELTGVTTR